MLPTLRITLAVLLATSAHAASAGQCDSKESARKTVAGLDANMASLKANQKKSEAAVQAQIDAITKNMVDSKRWTKEQSGKFYIDMMQSPAFAGFQKQKMDTLNGYMKATDSFVALQKKGDVVKACPQATKMLDALSVITGLNDKQYAYMLDSAKKAASK